MLWPFSERWVYEYCASRAALILSDRSPCLNHLQNERAMIKQQTETCWQSNSWNKMSYNTIISNKARGQWARFYHSKAQNMKRHWSVTMASCLNERLYWCEFEVKPNSLNINTNQLSFIYLEVVHEIILYNDEPNRTNGTDETDQVMRWAVSIVWIRAGRDELPWLSRVDQQYRSPVHKFNIYQHQ